MLLAVFITANGLQYTHDITHQHVHHHDDGPSAEHADHEHAGADECALCWFVFHQISSPFVFDSLLPEIAIQDQVSASNERYCSSCSDGVPELLGNKDPPVRG